jgi:DMSO/TMAO reductase YedYZ molybdopterin-dependent catalytic subunit
MEQAATPGGRRESTERGETPPGAEESGLIAVRQEPFNAEAPLAALRTPITPSDLFYVRSHFPVPALDRDNWRLLIEGGSQPRTLTFAELAALPAQTLTATLECAGNDRRGFTPPPPGEPWGSGAISTGVWRGVALYRVLELAGVPDSAVELLFEGADHGAPAGNDAATGFVRALPRAQAFAPDTLLAYEMNGAPLPPAPGGPVRLLVPDWYGVASVKWLTRIAALAAPFVGFFQTERYILDIPGQTTAEPLRTMAVKSLITDPPPGAGAAGEPVRVAGMAWSGAGPIATVEVSVDGAGWQPAHLAGAVPAHAWQPWEWEWAAPAPGRHTVRVRATDTQGNTQPQVAPWNRLGYVNNAIQALAIEIRAEDLP